MQIDTNILYNEDCKEVLKRLPDESIDLVVTDCPYHISHTGKSGGKGIFAMDNEFVQSGKLFEHNDIEFSEWLPEVYRVLKDGTHAYIMVNGVNLADLQKASEKVGFRYQNILVWKKNNATMNHFYMQCLEFILMLRKGSSRDVNDMGISNCLSVPNIIGNKCHPTEKPISLMQVMVTQSSNEGDIVLDPFAGGGSTLIAAKRTNRQYIGCEIDKKYYDIAIKRLSQTEHQLTLF